MVEGSWSGSLEVNNATDGRAKNIASNRELRMFKGDRGNNILSVIVGGGEVFLVIGDWAVFLLVICT